MKRRSVAMDTDAFISSKVSLVERDTRPMGIELVNPAAVGRTDKTSLVELAKEIEAADHFVQATAGAQLRLIAQQVALLRRQAEQVLNDTALSHRLHHAACNFRKVPGTVYHLYQSPSGQRYLSMLSPQEWGPRGIPEDHEFEGSYRLQHDMSWRAAEVSPCTPTAVAVDKIFGSSSQSLPAIDYSADITNDW